MRGLRLKEDVLHVKSITKGLLRGVAVELGRAIKEHELQDLKNQGILTVGAHTYGLPHVLRFDGDTTHISIGSYCSIGKDVV